MPITKEALQYPVATSFNSLSGSGGRHEPNISLKTIMDITKPMDRISTPEEPQDPVKPQVSTIYFNEDSKHHLDTVKVRQQQFDSELGINNNGNNVRSYNVVHDRVNFELAITNEQVQSVRNDLVKEMETNLRERYHTPLSVVKYVLDTEGNAYSEDDLYEPVDIKFQRGASFRINDQYSPEPEREQQTVEAGIIAKRKLADQETPLHSKVIVISPPGAEEGTIYKDNFVDIFESDKDPVTGWRIIRMFRFASVLNDSECREKIIKLKPDFKEVKGAFDVWCLSNPIFIDSRIDKKGVKEFFNQEFKLQEGITKEEDFQEILTGSLSIRQNYIDVVCGKIFNPREVAIAFNAVLNKADAIRKEIISRGKNFIREAVDLGRKVVNTFRNIKEEVMHWGRQVVKTVTAGCGISGGFSIGSIARAIGRHTSSGGSSKENRKGTCKDCGLPNTDSHYHCPDCNHKYADETARSAAERTKQCGCGFQFGC